VRFDPSQTDASSGNTPLPTGYASVAVYLEGYKAMQEYFPYQQFQIWRYNNPNGEGSPDSSINVAKQVARGTVVNPCNGELIPAASSESVPLGSTVTDVNLQFYPFNFVDSAGNTIYSNCRFIGAPYAPTANSGQGVVAGVVTCDEITVQCIRPDDNRPMTCSGGTPGNQCGELGKDCADYYQLIATCIM
jgi:hypothetical protein